MWDSVSDRLRAHIGHSADWSPVVELSDDGETWAPVDVVSCSVSADQGSQVRWSVTATVLTGAVSPTGTLVRAGARLTYGPDDTETVPLGVYRLNSSTRSVSSPGVWSITGGSFECALIDDTLDVARTFRAGSAHHRAETVIRETLPSAEISWGVADQWVPTMTTSGNDRWPIIDGQQSDASIARALACRVFAGRTGAFEALPVAKFTDTPAWSFEAGKTLISSAETTSRDNAFNRVSVRGESADIGALPVGPCVVSDNDPSSPYRPGTDPLKGGYGRKTMHYSSPLIVSTDQAQKTAIAMLYPLLGVAYTVDFQGAFNPLIDPNDVLHVDTPSGRVPVIVDSVSWDLSAGTQTVNCRAVNTVVRAQIVGSDSGGSMLESEG